MNTATMVDSMVREWKNQGLSKAEVIVKTAEACLGWPYVFGARGQYCTSANRKSRADSIRSGHPAEADKIISRCQILRGSKDTCVGCSFYPGGQTRTFDCRGFTYWLCLLVEITINGAGATSQWNDNNNWSEKGVIVDMPKDKVCCVFMQNQSDKKTMEHTGMHIGGGVIIHCSGTVQKGKTTDKGWTHYAIPKGLDGIAPTPDPDTKPTIRKGATGEYVKLAQELLEKHGYDVGKWGADGKFGAATEAAVRKFQSDKKLVVDGIVGSKTWTALLEDPAPAPSQFFTVHVPHLTAYQAEALMSTYVGSWQTNEE